MATSPLHQLHISHLLSLLHALRDRRLKPPLSPEAIGHYVPDGCKDAITAALQQQLDAGMSPRQLAFALELLCDEKRTQQQRDDRLHLVWSGPTETGDTGRSTSVVVQELFREATSAIWLSSYSLDNKENMTYLFGELAARMDREEALSVTMCLNIKRDLFRDEETPSDRLLQRFARRFRHELWPGERLPTIYYDPRALAPGWDKRACLHAKCVIVDAQQLFITSANFSEAAHKRNYEAGILLEDQHRATEMLQQFHRLIEAGALLALPWGVEAP